MEIFTNYKSTFLFLLRFRTIHSVFLFSLSVNLSTSLIVSVSQYLPAPLQNSLSHASPFPLKPLATKEKELLFLWKLWGSKTQFKQTVANIYEIRAC